MKGGNKIEFLICIILVLILALNFGEQLRKNSKIFYIIASIIAIADTIYRVSYASIPLPKIIAYLERPITIGALAGAMFAVVMYAGALDNKKSYTKKLMGVRAELSILASIFFLPHTIPNCISFFKVAPKMDMSSISTKIYFALSLTAIFALIIMLPLWITSYKSIRKKMNAKNWKKLQRFAYVMYFLIYAHISVLFLTRSVKQYDKFIIYTLIFGVYAFLRIKKAMSKKQLKNNKTKHSV